MANSRTALDDSNHPFGGTHIGLWLSWQELNGRRLVFFINVILIALLISLAVTVDLMGKARMSSVEDRIDYIGPSLSLVPKGIRSSDLVKADLKGRTFSKQTFTSLRNDFAQFLRGAETRLITNLHVGGKTMPVVGIDFTDFRSYPFSQFSLSNDQVLLGTITAEKLNRRIGDTVQIGSRSFMVAGIIDTTAGIDDVSLFMPMSMLQELTALEGRINEIRLFPSSASALEILKDRLARRYGQLGIVDSYRGETAEKDIDSTMQEYQTVIFAAAFILIALCIMISTYINLDGRKSEIATIYTVGARQGIIFQVLTFRTVWIALLGSVFGHVLALITVFAQDYRVPMLQIWSWSSFTSVVLGTIFLGLLVTMPFAFYSVYARKLTSHL